jgi:Putative binding domain, N-terminal
VAYQVAVNPTINPRTGSLIIGGQLMTVNQNGATCSYTLSAQNATFSAAAGDGSVNVTTLPGCSLTATSNVSWLTVTAPSAQDSASRTVAFHADANTDATSRTGTLIIGGQPMTVTQADGTSPGALRFVPVKPCRVADTRNPDGPFGGPLLAGKTTRDFAIPQSECGIPANAQAYSLNFTVVPSGKLLSYLTVFPTGQRQPLASTLNSYDGRIKANAALVPAGTKGAVSVFATEDTHLVIDINGYFVPASTETALAFYPVPPCRLVDTRGAAGPLGAPTLQAKEERRFPVLTSSCQVPATAQAYALNYTVVPKEPLSWLTTWPSGQAQPLVSTLNAPTGSTTANAAIVPAGENGDLSVYVTNSTELVIDISGYFAPPATGGLSLYNLAPCRVYDSRTLPGAQPLVNSTAIDVAGSNCQAPATAHAYVFNTTVVPTQSLPYLTLWPHAGEQPLASTLNAPDGAVSSNLAIVPTTDGSINAFPSDSTHLIFDIFGYFAP